VFSDHDRYFNDEEQAMQFDTEICSHYEEEIKLLENEHEQNTKNISR